MDSRLPSPPPALHSRSSGLSFRSRLGWASILVVLVSVVGVAWYILYRTSLTTIYLTHQVTNQVTQQAEKNLRDTASGQSAEMDAFFSEVASNMTTLQIAIHSLLTRESDLNVSGYWDARQDLTTLPNGNWDNANNEPGSVFLPAGTALTDDLVSEMNTLKQMDFIAPAILKNNPDMIALYFGGSKGETLYYPNVDLSVVLPPNFDIRQRPWYLAAAPEKNPQGKVVWSVPYQDAALHGLVVTASVPVYDASGKFRGVAAADLQLTNISNRVQSLRVARTGYAFLLDGEGRVIAMPEIGYTDFGLNPQDFTGDQALTPILDQVPLHVFEILTKMTSKLSGMKTVQLNGVEKYIAYQPIPSIGYSLGVVAPVDETQAALIATREQLAQETQKTLTNIIITLVFLLVISLLVSRWMGNTLARPLVELTRSATRLAEGDLNVQVVSHARDEFGVLANAFNVMTARMRDLIGSLEQRVAERTADLEKATSISQKRAQQLEVVSEVARAVSTEVNLERLLTLVSEVVSQRFGFYHVGVFLLDPLEQNAVLRASNSAGGKRMIARGHKLPVGQVGIVGRVTASGEPRIALDVGEDAAFFNNPDLPETRSEMALPLRVRGHIIGALDVQSKQANAFTSADVETLGILADQVAIAIENARLFEEAQKALEESRTQYGETISRAWEQKTAQAIIGYRIAGGTGHAISEPAAWEEIQSALESGKPVVLERENDSAAIAVPIRLQDQVIGVIDVRSPEAGHYWTRDEVAIAEAVADRLALALENARLFEEATGRAAREHAVAEITSKIRETNDPQVMIRTAIQELQRTLKASRVEIIPHVVSVPPSDAGPGGKLANP